jgi:regulatory protein
MNKNMPFNTALSKAMTLCAGREMCYSDIRQKIISWGIRDESIDKILNLLTESKFIDEERYAVAFSKDKFRYNKWGRLKIGSGLRMKKIPDEIIRKALDSINETEYIELLRILIEKQRRSVKAKNEYELKGKLLRYGLSKGFESHLLYNLLNEGE